MTSPSPSPTGGVVLHRALGLTDDEAAAITSLLGREPNHLELAMYAVMWSEHCSYKSSRVHLGRLPTEGEQVLVGPGENAGVIDAGGGMAVALRIESHNHPSAIEPYQGAATGVGGILRDIFTMGARPIAIMDPLRFGPLDDARSRWIASGVIAGISGYGNSVGVPTVGGEVVFDACYADNPLVNVLCCGVLPADRLVLGAATGVGNLAVLLGSATGRDGIGGVSVLASAGFSDDAAAEEAKRPNVQVGDPFEEKRLIEACLELLDAKLVVGIQDLGGAGLTCATSETASRGGVGMDVSVADVPQRETGMEAWEVLTSESQERMLAIVTPASLDRVLEVCGRWEVRAAVVGKVTDTGRLRILTSFDADADVLADVPASTLHEDAPKYHRPLARPAWLDELAAADPAALAAPDDCGADLLSLLVDPAWVYRQYDHQLFLNTVVAPGGDAALLRLAAPGVRGPLDPAGGGFEGAADAIALSTDGNARWCALDPRAGTIAVVAESALNLACVGARPVALVNCLNFGNPEHPEVMWQLSEAIDGMSEACVALGIPVIGGNVSLYNESRGRDIDPTPVVGTLGLVDRLERRPPPPALSAGSRIVMIAPAAAIAGGSLGGSLAGSLWADKVRGHRGGVLPPVDLDTHGRLLAMVADLVGAGIPAGVHDVSEGGIGLALAEMAVAGRTGCQVSGIADHVALFGEGPSRVLVALPASEASGGAQILADLVARADAAGLAVVELGAAGGDRIVVEGLLDVSVEEAGFASTSVLDDALGLGGGAA
ncbi:phosphoribosylformylglycinamidine synthase subunit PurL [Acidiferrimicrobium sp. IK]|uniref:phosphoribosylformylglycinamidine synthase subunit PurL n=1 Tax=Acidiferrimicrobium sp. IK TaxID=2871700 RepID=UPI0021CB38DB|nr:phosphoribosylformylglycinamidine synthase subunit PurL [Acidiferrimicrobium sp. IK]MCU4182964.1 phosphoribosylformylglycinamidine synthase subunit PurL [Acidiferrimicrobium sp. IK]